MLIGTNRWVLLVEGEMPPGVDPAVIQADLTSMSVPLRLLPLIRNTRLLQGTQEQLDELFRNFPG